MSNEKLFKLEAPYKPTGDRPQAIASLWLALKKTINARLYWGLRGLERHSPWRISFRH